MYEKEYNVIGVMSGTSLDGIDLVHINFSFNTYWNYRILKGETVEYTEFWGNQLKSLTQLTLEQIKALDQNYTRYLASIIKDFIIRNNIKNIDAVCSHGHTAWHRPDEGMTYQIGNLPSLAEFIQQTVVCDFRIQDVLLGGQGAPLVPIGDSFLFSQYDYCLNLGGFANVSTLKDNERLAFDICPANIVLNKYIYPLAYDDGGQQARMGKVNVELLSQLNALDFYKQNAPKSLGLEWVERHIYPLINGSKLKLIDILRTFTEHIAMQIAEQLSHSCSKSMLVTGGGAYNTFLIERLQALSIHKLYIPDSNLIEFKEGLIFGLLGVLKLRGEVNCLKSVTGATRNHCSGLVFKYDSK